MKNVLIVSCNFDFCKEINNNINDNAKIINISENIEEGLDNIIKLKPNVVILEKDVQYYKVVYLMQQLDNVNNYKPIIIAINAVDYPSISMKYQNIVFVKRKSKYYLMLYKIFKYIDDDLTEDSIDSRILTEMKKMGFEMKNKGDYLILNVVKYIKNNGSLDTNLEKDIYPKISALKGIPEKQVKWNINYSINSLYDTKQNQLCKYLQINDMIKPTSKYLIFTLLNNI